MKENIKFHDKTNSICNIDIKIDNGNLSMLGEYNGSMGQCIDNIIPRNKYQKELIDIWKKYHLNNMKPGTKEQMKLLEGFNDDYNLECKRLKSIDIEGNDLSVEQFNKSNIALEKFHNMKDLYNKKLISDYSDDLFISAYVVKLKDEGLKPYEYGTGWINKELPDDIKERVCDLINNIEKIEQEEYSKIITEESYNNTKDIKYEVDNIASELGVITAKILAICIQCNITLESLLEDGITKSNYNDNEFNIESQDWLVCTDSEADEEYLESVESIIDDIGFEGLNGVSGPYCELVDGSIQVSQSVTFDSCERGETLNRYDGSEYNWNVLGEDIYMYKQ